MKRGRVFPRFSLLALCERAREYRGKPLFFNGDSRCLRIWSIAGNFDWRALWSLARGQFCRVSPHRRNPCVMISRSRWTHVGRPSLKNIKILEHVLHDISMFYLLANEMFRDVFKRRRITVLFFFVFFTFTPKTPRAIWYVRIEIFDRTIESLWS